MRVCKLFVAPLFFSVLVLITGCNIWLNNTSQSERGGCRELRLFLSHHWEKDSLSGVYIISDSVANWQDPNAQESSSDVMVTEPKTIFEAEVIRLVDSCYTGHSIADLKNQLGTPSRTLGAYWYYDIRCQRKTAFCQSEGYITLDTTSKIISSVEGSFLGIKIK